MAGAPPEAGADDEEFNDLLRSVMAGDNSKIATASEASVRRLQTMINPYTHTVSGSESEEKVRHLACSWTNMKREHIERVVMTSMVGFLFRMYKEWEVPVEARRWKAEDFDASKKKDTAMPAQELVDRAKELLAAAEEALAAERAAEAATLKAADADILRMEAQVAEGVAASPEQLEKDEALAQELADSARLARGLADGLQYVAHRNFVEVGERARHGLEAAAEIAKKHGEVRDYVEKDPTLVRTTHEEVPEPVAKEVIGQFLRTWFEYDPDIHVRSANAASRDGRLDAHKAASPEDKREKMATGDARPFVSDLDDPERLTLYAMNGSLSEVPELVREAFEASVTSVRTRKAVKHILADPVLRSALGPVLADTELPHVLRQCLAPIEGGEKAETAAAVEVHPPADTFHRWGYYRDVNWEELRDAAEALYGFKIDLEEAIAPFEVFEGTEAEAAEAYQKYKQMNADSLRTTLYSITFGRWNFAGPWKANRDRIDFYNKNTRIIQKILERHEEDKKLGMELMKKRVVKAKAKNIREAGPDAPGLAEYRAVTGGSDIGEKVIDDKTMTALIKGKGSVAQMQELRDYEKLLGQKEALEKKEKLRPLTKDEAEEYENLTKRVALAKEMLEVPDDAVQVDVFQTDGTGFMKSKFYTEAEEPEDPSKKAPGAAAGGAGGRL